MKSNLMLAFTAAVFLLAFTPSNVFAQETKSLNRTTISVETDPTTFVFNGYAVHFRIKPKQSRRLLIGAGTYAMDFPSFFVDMNKDNKGMGWNVRIQSAFSLFSEYYLKEANHKWFVGLQAGVQNYTIGLENIPAKKNYYSTLLVMPSFGYNWAPFKFPLYIKPWIGLGYMTKLFGTNGIEPLKYKVSPLTPFITLHVGYTFRK